MKKFFTPVLLFVFASSFLFSTPLQAQTAPDSPVPKATQAQAPWAALGTRPEDVRITSTHSDARSGLELVYVEQLHQGIPIYCQDLTLAFAQGRLVHQAGAIVPRERLAGLAAVPTIAASAAVLAAVRPLPKQGPAKVALLPTSAASAGPEARQTFAAPGLARRDIVARLVWAPDDRQQLRLAWNVNIDVLGSPDWLNIRVDALTGAIIGQDNWTVHEAPKALVARSGSAARALAPLAGASRAQAFPLVSPAAATATTAAKYLVLPFPKADPTSSFQSETDPWLKAGATNDATTHGWHYDGSNTYAYTRGNNVFAYVDATGTNPANPTTYAASLAAVPSLDFTYVHNFAQTPALALNRNSATTNLFYWNNIVHDVLYQYGFTEAAGNFQTDNLSRGGAGADAVRAEAQDGSGTNNANFSTPVDGLAGRMQMYLFDGPPTTRVTAPSAIAGDYYSLESSFSTANKLISRGPVSGALMYYTDASGGTHEACGTNPALVLTGKIAVVNRGTCGFTTKVKEAQTRGASAVVVINNAPGAPIAMGGTDNTIIIPAVMISQADGLTLTTAMASGPVAVTLLATPQLDGDLDNGIVTHEYGHGVSTRLTGGRTNSSCLNNAEEGGEGWSDFFALMFTTDWASTPLTAGATARPMGTYVVGQPATGGGIRRYPYSTSLDINPLTYADMTANPEVHDIGEIWCATLWDMTWNIIQQQNAIAPNLYNSASTGGNNVALQLVMLGLKLQPCQPGFLNARDAILAADDVLYSGAYHCAIWRAFARRGMGQSAVQGLATSATDQVAAYDVPGGARLQKVTEPLIGNALTVTLTATCNCQVPLANYVLTDALPPGMEYVSSSGGTFSGNTVTFSNLAFTTPAQARTLTIQAKTATGAGSALTYPVNDNRDASTVGGFVAQSVTGALTTWAAGTARYHTPTAAWSITGTTHTGDIALTSGSFTPGTASVLSFYHYYDYETTYDGGTVELSASGGAWQDASPYFISNGYTGSFLASGLPCFSGVSAAASAPTDFIKSTLDLSSFSGVPLRIRFRSQTDNSVASPGWAVDDILITNGFGGPQQVRLYSNTSVLMGSATIVTFLTPPALPVELLRFEAQWKPEGAQLTWATASEQNTDRFVVERSLNGRTWDAVGTVAAAGTSTSQLSYRLLDATALQQPAGLLYYRLRQRDRDGSEQFSPLRTVARPAGPETFVLSAVPNPVAGKTLHLTLTAPAAQTQAELSLIDATGRALWREKVPLTAGTAALDWPRAAELPAGLYLVQARLSNGQRLTVRVVRE